MPVSASFRQLKRSFMKRCSETMVTKKNLLRLSNYIQPETAVSRNHGLASSFVNLLSFQLWSRIQSLNNLSSSAKLFHIMRALKFQSGGCEKKSLSTDWLGWKREKNDIYHCIVFRLFFSSLKSLLADPPLPPPSLKRRFEKIRKNLIISLFPYFSTFRLLYFSIFAFLHFCICIVLYFPYSGHIPV